MKITYYIADEKHFYKLAHLRLLFKDEDSDDRFIFIEKYIDYLKQESELSRLKVFCAEVDGEIVANINLILIPKSPKPRCEDMKLGYITNTFVLDAFRNKGIGSKLLKQIEEYSKDNSIELLFVWPSEESIKYYERIGFESKNDIMEKLI